MDYDDDNDYNDEEGGLGELEKGAYDRMYTTDTIDVKNPKEVFINVLNNNASSFGISDDELDFIKSEYISNFREIQFKNYNAKGILFGYILYKNKVKNSSEFQKIFDKYKGNADASKADAIRYMRLWKMYLTKSIN